MAYADTVEILDILDRLLDVGDLESAVRTIERVHVFAGDPFDGALAIRWASIVRRLFAAVGAEIPPSLNDEMLTLEAFSRAVLTGAPMGTA